MEWKWAWAALGTWMVLLGGCSHPQQQRPDIAKVTVEGGGTFPPTLAGRWKARQDGWEIEIGPDGRIVSAILSMGRVRVLPGRTTAKPTKSGDQAVFTPGPWVAYYAPSTRELTMKIVMDHVRVEMAGNIVEGSSTDVFSGPIAPTNNTWQAQWTTFTRYITHSADNATFDLSSDPTNGATKLLIFDKVATSP